MNKKDLKAISILGGILTIVGALTASSNSKNWKDVHTAAVIGGSAAMVIGAIA